MLSYIQSEGHNLTGKGEIENTHSKGVFTMKMKNDQGQQIYFNEIVKAGKTAYVVKAITPGLMIPDRDRKTHRSRTFTQLAQAENWLNRNGYRGC